LIKPSPWTIISRRRRTARGSLAIERATPSHFTRSTILLKAVGVTTHTSIMVISVKGTATTTMVIGTMKDSRETIPIVTPMVTMVITMETMASTIPIQGTIGTCPTSHATSVRRLGTLPKDAPRTSLRRLPNLIQSRRDRRTTCMWRK
jgi:hypothetical protein